MLSSDETMDAELAIQTWGLSKSYRNARIGSVDSSLREQFSTLVLKPWRMFARHHSENKNNDIHALQPVHVSVPKGQKLGILGRNGSGKSTLLKLLARITEPSAGKAMIRGRVAAILEVGTGFHPELTGAENVFLNGAILGLSRSFIRSRMPSIVDFAELHDSMNLPVKRYSSGMYVRLAFAVAAHIDSDVLLVDEVLAVGDEGFRKKCIEKMEAEARSGRTLIFVTHDTTAIRQFCDRVITMDKGRIVHDGDVEVGIKHYETCCNEPRNG